MKRIPFAFPVVILAAFLLTGIGSCRKTDNPVKYPEGTFPDTLINLAGLNSEYDDYNMSLNELNGGVQLVFSSNRGSSGGQFDFVQGLLTYTFNQTNGDFSMDDEITDDPFLKKLLSATNTGGNDFGPYRFFSTADGYDYMVYASENNGNLDLFYTKNQPYTSTIPDIKGPYPVTLLNSDANEAYFCLDANQDTAYFTSDKGGDFDIYFHSKPAAADMDTWLTQAYETSTKADDLNSTSDDKCPFVYKKIMVFASNRPGGFGGYDLYYSLFNNGRWNAPVNFGESVNTASDEYRPVIGGDENFTNLFLIFSSNRPGGKGGFDLYFKGIDYLK